jgi:transcription elongation factor GreA
MSDEIILTPGGKRKLEEELDHLRSVEMPALSERIRQARDLGDLSENFDYQDAKRQQGFVAGRVKDIEMMLSRAKIVESAAGGDVIGMGSTVHLRDLDEEEESSYTLVGASESDPANKRLSVSSPIGKALMGKKKGDKILVTTPGGSTEFEILNVS